MDFINCKFGYISTMPKFLMAHSTNSKLTSLYMRVYDVATATLSNTTPTLAYQPHRTIYSSMKIQCHFIAVWLIEWVIDGTLLDPPGMPSGLSLNVASSVKLSYIFPQVKIGHSASKVPIAYCIYHIACHIIMSQFSYDIIACCMILFLNKLWISWGNRFSYSSL